MNGERNNYISLFPFFLHSSVHHKQLGLQLILLRQYITTPLLIKDSDRFQGANSEFHYEAHIDNKYGLEGFPM